MKSGHVDVEVTVRVFFTVWSPWKAHRDSLGGIPAAGPATEPDEIKTVLLGIIEYNGQHITLSPEDEMEVLAAINEKLNEKEKE